MVQGHDEVCGVLGDVNIDVPVTGQQLRHTVGQVGAGDVVRMPLATALSNFSRPLVKSGKVALAMMRFAPRSFRLVATSSMLSPDAMMSSATKTVLPSTESPRYSWATMGLRPLTTRV